jgi:hypothetical protein
MDARLQDDPRRSAKHEKREGRVRVNRLRLFHGGDADYRVPRQDTSDLPLRERRCRHPRDIRGRGACARVRSMGWVMLDEVR